MTTIYFVRHAQPDYSILDDRIRPLTEKGQQDSKKVTEFLTDKKVDIIFSSSYKRAIDTVKDFADSYGLKINVIEDFRERQIDSSWIEDFKGFAKQQWENFDYKLPHGECLNEVQQRNISALVSILRNHSEQVIIIATHGTALSTIINYYNSSFSWKDFSRIVNFMPFIVKMEFEKTDYKNMEEFVFE